MIAITVDCEQWNSLFIRGKEDEDKDNTDYSREGNNELLKILNKHNIKATFFVTGFFAEKEKEQIRRISKKHEIASHGYNHFYRGNKNLNLEGDISKSKKIIEKIIDKKIIGFRAPQAQFSKELIEVLKKLNFKYDSSIHSAWLPGFYNNRDKPLMPFKAGKVLEIPANSSYNLRLPFSWIFMRNLPLFYSVRTVRKLLRKNITPIFYVHSWEFINIKNKKGLPLGYLRNTGKKFCEKFDKFLENFKDEKFVTMEEIYNMFKAFPLEK